MGDEPGSGSRVNRILLADDSPQALRLAERILSGEGIEVVSVSDGVVAQRRLQDVRPDLLITDVYLPGRNAFDLARFLRSQPEFAHTRVIFAAAPADEFDEQDARNAGADFILRKPFEASTLLGVVRNLLEQSAQLRSPAPGTRPLADRHSVRAAVTLALDRSMPAMIEELTEQVMRALAHRLP